VASIDTVATQVSDLICVPDRLNIAPVSAKSAAIALKKRKRVRKTFQRTGRKRYRNQLRALWFAAQISLPPTHWRANAHLLLTYRTAAHLRSEAVRGLQRSGGDIFVECCAPPT
jgi:hypothetical protein